MGPFCNLSLASHFHAPRCQAPMQGAPLESLHESIRRLDPELLRGFGVDPGMVDRPVSEGGLTPKQMQSLLKMRPGDWLCPSPSCGNHNYSTRMTCNRCQTARPSGSSSAVGGHRATPYPTPTGGARQPSYGDGGLAPLDGGDSAGGQHPYPSNAEQ